MSTETVQTTTTQSPVPQVPVSPPTTPDVPSQQKPDDMSSKFAALAKKERMARMAHTNLKTREQKIAEREKAIADRERQWDEEFKVSPLEAIKRRGYSYEDLTKAALNEGKFDPATEVKTVKDEIAKFREEQEAKEKQARESQQNAALRAEQEAVSNFQSKISESIEANKEKFELVHLYDASELVFNTVEEHFLRTQREGKPKILSIDEACELVEQYLESEVERMATSSKKFQSKYKSEKPKEGEPAKTGPKTSTTITNEHTSTAPSLLPQATENDRIKRALAALG